MRIYKLIEALMEEAYPGIGKRQPSSNYCSVTVERDKPLAKDDDALSDDYLKKIEKNYSIAKDNDHPLTTDGESILKLTREIRRLQTLIISE